MTTETLETLKPLKLFEYQKIGARWLADNCFALLADRQRLGKTCQSIRAAELSHSERILVICKAVAVSQWESEFKKWWPEFKGALTVMSYEAATAHELIYHLKWNLIIVDEAHYLKNPQAKRTQKVLGRQGLLHKTDKMWLLTGTPMPNHFGELWVLLYSFGATTLSYDAFIKRYCICADIGYGISIRGSKQDPALVDELRSMLKPVMLRRTEKDVAIQLPEKFHTTITVKPGKVDLNDVFPELVAEMGLEALKKVLHDELGLYNSIVGSTASELLIETLKANAKSISTLRRFTAMQKIDPLVELIEDELENKAYNKVVIFCIHTAAVKTLMRKLKRFNPVCVVGGTSKPDEVIKKFQDPKSNNQVFLGNIDAAGTSIELSIANHIYFLEEDWVPGKNHQAAMRCGGINQKLPMFVKSIYLENSVDLKVGQIINRKTQEQSLLFG